MKLELEFFHDVICSFCYPMSDRMRDIVAEYPEIDLVHRSFALAPTSDSLAQQFGSRERAKEEILSHWHHANQNDEKHRFNIDGMRKTDFLFPTSMNALKASKAASFIDGQKGYWDVFDALQKGLFTDNVDIENESIIFELVKPLVSNFDEFVRLYQSNEVVEAIHQDLLLSNQYGIHSVPAVVIDQKYLISGAQPKEVIKRTLDQILEMKKAENKKPLEVIQEGESCRFEDGQWICD